MTRIDWGEGFTYTGPLNEQYYGTWSSEELSEYLELILISGNVFEPGASSEFVEYTLGGLEPVLDALEGKASDYIKMAAEVRELIAKNKESTSSS